MSFSYNPYKHIELIKDEEIGGWKWYCHSCGGEDPKPGSFDLVMLVHEYFLHVMKSHKRSQDDFEGWTKY